jgi:hypothetical protein
MYLCISVTSQTPVELIALCLHNENLYVLGLLGNIDKSISYRKECYVGMNSARMYGIVNLLKFFRKHRKTGTHTFQKILEQISADRYGKRN